MVHHALSVVLEPTRHVVTVDDSIALPPDLCHAGAVFTLNSALTVGSSTPSVTKVASDNESEARYTLDAAPSDGLLKISYSGTIDHGLSDEKEQYTRGFRESRGILSTEGVYLHGGSAWVPSFDDRLIQFELQVKAPNEWHVISQGSGASLDEGGHAHWKTDLPVEQVYLVGGPLHVRRDMAGTVEVLVYLHEPDEALSGKYLETTAQYLEMYRDLIGPYPYGKFALVENFWETGYGMPSFTLLGPQVIRFPFILHSSYPHEILHNWWGNSVFVDFDSGNWCEGLTAYMADHLIQEQRGKGDEYRRNTLQKYRNYVRAEQDFPLSEFRGRHSAATEAVGYGKALMFFHMLRRHVGDEHFRAALADFYRQQRGRRASYADLRAAFEAVTHEDLSPFFRQWVERTGAPFLALRKVEAKATGDRYTLTGVIEQTQDNGAFELEVPLRVQTTEGTVTRLIKTSAKSLEFSVELGARPLSVAADPMFDLFRVLDPHETPPSIGQLFGEQQILAILPEASATEKNVAAYRALLEGWQSDEHKIAIVSEGDVKSLPNDRAVWVLGRRNRFRSDVLDNATGASLNDSAGTLTLAGENVSLAAHSEIIVGRHPGNPEKAIGWLVVDPAAAFPGMGRKLPHYGKYSYLAFEGDEPTNVVKGQWDAAGSPLVVVLDRQALVQAPPSPTESRPALAELPPVFSQKRLMEHVSWLASPERAGRGLGSAELRDSADYIAKQMASAGLKPAGDDGTWFQNFTVPAGPDGKPVEATNVVGLLPGTRDDWSDQSVILGAHYDHLGRGWPDVHAGDEGKIHCGADDNASGVAIMLELARNLAAERGGLRNLVVVAFSAEECGRLGSQHYVKHAALPASGIQAVINLDTVGRLFDGKIAIHGTATADEWPHIFRGCGFVTGIPNTFIPSATEGSDQESFIAAGIPAVQIFTGAHADYHRPGDTVDKIDGPGLVKVATFVKEAVTYLLAREAPMTNRIESAQKQSAPTAHPNASPRRVSFGTVPDFAFQGTGVRVESTVPDSPAARAGVLPGDVLIRLDGRDIANLRAFSDFLKTLAPDQAVDATLLRDGVEVKIRVVVKER
ncbi:MAG: M20/M25/M40 family metallo-hydrolase [Phycisphaerales bacterium]|nr:M20/M25/M40 family metallo-hydrolase [Phycisphaerales bacterium]MCB9854202.1 M20/M25/M40 family metallo-hydrolase [Phycisphaerales bacterium]MCB9864279.1 M20/M25/M40 family metallo-hydrolase [Phycisphaerales bacterium]